MSRSNDFVKKEFQAKVEAAGLPLDWLAKDSKNALFKLYKDN